MEIINLVKNFPKVNFNGSKQASSSFQSEVIQNKRLPEEPLMKYF